MVWCIRTICLSLAVLILFSGIAQAEPDDATTLPDNVELSGQTVTEEASVQTSSDTQDDMANPPAPSIWKRFVPVPIFITEPAVGSGLGLAVGYFHPRKNATSRSSNPVALDLQSANDPVTSRKPPPTVTGVFGGYTNNGTYFAGVGHANTFRDDSIRLLVGAGYADIIADIYILGIPFEFNLEGEFAFGDVRLRFGELPLFWGLSISYLDANNEFRLPLPEKPIGLYDFDLTNIGLGGRLMWDTRDDPMYPEVGQMVDLSVTVHDPGLGGDYDYDIWKLKALTFHPLGERFVLGGRLQYQSATGAPPFFAVPWVSMRGIPALRYQGDQVAMVETELRYRISERWVGLAFAGLGWREQRRTVPSEDIYNYGLGGRFRVLSETNVWMGLDLARGPEDTYWYVQVGQAW